MKKFTLWMVSLFSLLFIAGCGNEQQQVQQTQSQTPTTEAPKPASVDVEGTWQAVDFRDTLEKVFLLQYDDAASRLKATEALKDVVPVLKIQGNKVTFEYTANISKFLDAYGDVIGKKQFSYKENAINYIVGLAKTTYGNLKYHTVDWNEQTSTIKSVLKDGVLDTKTQTITFPEVPNIFAVIPLYITDQEKPIKYQYEILGDTMTIKAERILKEENLHLVYQMKFKKVQN